MPALAVVVVSLLLNINFFIRWKRRDRWDEEEEIIELQVVQEADAFEETTEEQVDAHRRLAVPELPRIADFFQSTDDENDIFAPEEDTLRMTEYFKANDEGRDDSASESSGIPRRREVAEPPRIAEFFTVTDDETNETAHALPDIPCSSRAAEPPRIADFLVSDDETDGEEGSACDSMDSEHPLLSHYMERMDFEGKDDSDDEPVLK